MQSYNLVVLRLQGHLKAVRGCLTKSVTAAGSVNHLLDQVLEASHRMSTCLIKREHDGRPRPQLSGVSASEYVGNVLLDHARRVRSGVTIKVVREPLCAQLACKLVELGEHNHARRGKAPLSVARRRADPWQLVENLNCVFEKSRLRAGGGDGSRRYKWITGMAAPPAPVVKWTEPRTKHVEVADRNGVHNAVNVATELCQNGPSSWATVTRPVLVPWREVHEPETDLSQLRRCRLKRPCALQESKDMLPGRTARVVATEGQSSATRREGVDRERAQAEVIHLLYTYYFKLTILCVLLYT